MQTSNEIPCDVRYLGHASHASHQSLGLNRENPATNFHLARFLIKTRTVVFSPLTEATQIGGSEKGRKKAGIWKSPIFFLIVAVINLSYESLFKDSVGAIPLVFNIFLSILLTDASRLLEYHPANRFTGVWPVWVSCSSVPFLPRTLLYTSAKTRNFFVHRFRMHSTWSSPNTEHLFFYFSLLLPWNV